MGPLPILWLAWACVAGPATPDAPWLPAGRLLVRGAGTTEVAFGDGVRPAIVRQELELWWTTARDDLRGAAWLVGPDGRQRGAAPGVPWPLLPGEALVVEPRPEDRCLGVLVADADESLGPLVAAAGDGTGAWDEDLGRARLLVFDFRPPPG